MDIFKKTVVIIPSLSPDERLLETIDAMKKYGFTKFVVVNDGSDAEYDSFFERASKAGAKVLKHDKNKGKGVALKTAFSFVMDSYLECEIVVTADSDGQHKAADIYRCALTLFEKKDVLVLGSRDFKMSHVPFRSRFGNQITCKVFAFFTGILISDTQTGLRAIPVSFLPELLKVEGERFEYETNMLLKTKELNLPICEVPIETVYIEENKHSHFNPVRDSIKIYEFFIRFILSAFSSFLIDIGLFYVLTYFLDGKFPVSYIALATVISRVISSVYNYTINKYGVFGHKKDMKGSVTRYYILVSIQMIASATLVSLLHVVCPMNESIIKMIVDGLLFIISFQIQREWVFKK